MLITGSTVKQISMNKGRDDLCGTIADAITKQGDRFHLDNPQRIKHFLGQICIESGFMTKLEESLYYSAERMVIVWPSRFKSVKAAQPYAKNGRALAMHVYGAKDNRLGNLTPEDGWTFRGRSPKQLTGRYNYTKFNSWFHQFYPDAPDFVKNPDALLDLQWTMAPALWFWDSNNCWQHADRDDSKGVTRSINGGLTDWQARLTATAYAGKILNIRTDPAVQLVKPKEADPLLKQYQGYLKKLSVVTKNPVLDPGKVDGWNGDKTEAAASALQKMCKLNVDGKLGPNTRKAIDMLMEKFNVAR